MICYISNFTLLPLCHHEEQICWQRTTAGFLSADSVLLLKAGQTKCFDKSSGFFPSPFRNYGGVYVGLPADLTTVAASQSKSTRKGEQTSHHTTDSLHLRPIKVTLTDEHPVGKLLQVTDMKPKAFLQGGSDLCKPHF